MYMVWQLNKLDLGFCAATGKTGVSAGIESWDYMPQNFYIEQSLGFSSFVCS